MSTTTMTAAEVRAAEERIAELAATPRALVGSDSGTHARPAVHDVYETITGERYATRSFAGANAIRVTEAEAKERTEGRIRTFPEATKEIRAKARELEELRRAVRRAAR
jgi:hypothetical protein